MWPEDGILSGIVWETPLDFMLTTTSIQHWPQIVFKLFHRSIWLGRYASDAYFTSSLFIRDGCKPVAWVGKATLVTRPGLILCRPTCIGVNTVTQLSVSPAAGCQSYASACQGTILVWLRSAHVLRDYSSGTCREAITQQPIWSSS